MENYEKLKKEVLISASKLIAGSQPEKVYSNKSGKAQQQLEEKQSIVNWVINQMIKDKFSITFERRPFEREKYQERWNDINIFYTSPKENTFRSVDADLIERIVSENAVSTDFGLFNKLETGEFNSVELAYRLKTIIWRLFGRINDVFDAKSKSNEAKKIGTVDNIFEHNYNLISKHFSTFTVGKNILDVWNNYSFKLPKTMEQVENIRFTIDAEGRMNINYNDPTAKVVKGRDQEQQVFNSIENTISFAEAMERIVNKISIITHEPIDPLSIQGSYIEAIGNDELAFLTGWLDSALDVAEKTILSINKDNKVYGIRTMRKELKSLFITRDNVIASLVGVNIGDIKRVQTKSKAPLLLLNIKLNEGYPKGWRVSSDNFVLARTTRRTAIYNREKESDRNEIENLRVTSILDWGKDQDKLLKDIYSVSNDIEARTTLWNDLTTPNSELWRKEKFLKVLVEMFGRDYAFMALISLSLVFLDRNDSSKIHHFLTIYGTGGTGKSSFINSIKDWFVGVNYVNNEDMVVQEKNAPQRRDIFTTAPSLEELYNGTFSYNILESCLVVVTEIDEGSLPSKYIQKVKSQTAGESMEVRKIWKTQQMTTEPAHLLLVGNTKFDVPSNGAKDLGRRLHNLKVVRSEVAREVSDEKLLQTVYDKEYKHSMTRMMFAAIEFVQNPIDIEGLKNKKGEKVDTDGFIRMLIHEAQFGQEWNTKDEIEELFYELALIYSKALESSSVMNVLDKGDNADIAIYYNQDKVSNIVNYRAVFGEPTALFAGVMRLKKIDDKVVVEKLSLNKFIIDALIGVDKGAQIKYSKVLKSIYKVNGEGKVKRSSVRIGSNSFRTWKRPDMRYASLDTFHGIDTPVNVYTVRDEVLNRLQQNIDTYMKEINTLPKETTQEESDDLIASIIEGNI